MYELPITFLQLLLCRSFHSTDQSESSSQIRSFHVGVGPSTWDKKIQPSFTRRGKVGVRPMIIHVILSVSSTYHPSACGSPTLEITGENRISTVVRPSLLG